MSSISSISNSSKNLLQNENDQIIVKLYQGNIKRRKRSSEEAILDQNPYRWKSYTRHETLPGLVQTKMSGCLTTQGLQLEQVEVKKPDKIDLKAKAIFSETKNLDHDSQDSNMEFSDLGSQENIFIFQKTSKIPAAVMTVSCSDQNMKGSELIKIVHEEIRFWYRDIIDCACEYENDLGGAVIPPPKVKDGILHIEEPREWFMTLGGWKGMMPNKEIKEYFFEQEKRFTGVCFHQNGLVYPIKQHRIHLPAGFSINQIDITASWEKREGKWVKKPLGKTDLSYRQIIKGIKIIKKAFKLEDGQIALLQLHLLTQGVPFPDQFEQQVPTSENQKEIIQFLDYLNGLMFGIEASGLNAALVISLMTLELIIDKKINYETAFHANNDGGVYPYACFGNNRGTYRAREEVLLDGSQDYIPPSMKRFRKDSFLSPVAVKEAILIKYWLTSNEVITKKRPYAEQRDRVRYAIRDLIDFYYSSY